MFKLLNEQFWSIFSKNNIVKKYIFQLEKTIKKVLLSFFPPFVFSYLEAFHKDGRKKRMLFAPSLKNFSLALIR